jgi:hypothetical protein
MNESPLPGSRGDSRNVVFEGGSSPHHQRTNAADAGQSFDRPAEIRMKYLEFSGAAASGQKLEYRNGLAGFCEPGNKPPYSVLLTSRCSSFGRAEADIRRPRPPGI